MPGVATFRGWDILPLPGFDVPPATSRRAAVIQFTHGWCRNSLTLAAAYTARMRGYGRVELVGRSRRSCSYTRSLISSRSSVERRLSHKNWASSAFRRARLLTYVREQLRQRLASNSAGPFGGGCIPAADADPATAFYSSGHPPGCGSVRPDGPAGLTIPNTAAACRTSASVAAWMLVQR